MDPAFVAWMTGLKPGQEYDPDDLERANKRLSQARRVPRLAHSGGGRDPTTTAGCR